MLIRTKIAFAAALATAVVVAGQASAASRHYRAPAGQLVDRPVSLPNYSGYENSSRYSGPFRTDASPNSGGS
jgi:hypothetical protein